jgi:YidC/Oxa1 family membrane protein insertase
VTDVASSAAAAAAAFSPSMLAPFLMAHLPPLADIDPAAAADAVNTAAAASTDSGGVMGTLANGFEAILRVLESGLEGAGVPYAYGFAIILLTLMVKLATYPLSRKSMESTASMQALQPRVKELQARYANDPETLQLETARLYRDAGVNPLAGCLPTLATIPVFIGLYKALTKAADDGLLQAGFFWIPSLAGPTTLESRQAGAGLSWLFPLVDGAPPIGWHDALSYLILPVLLVASQFVSQKIMSPTQSDDPAAKQSQNILKFIPLMIGWFSLNVPSGLTLYWFVNNIISTAQQSYMKRSLVGSPAVAAASAAATGSSARAELRPKEERAGPSGRELGARKKQRQEGVIDVEASSPAASTSSSGPSPSSSPSSSSVAAAAAAAAGAGGQRGNKFRARKAREAAARAASIAGKGSNGNGNGNGAAAAAAAAAPAAKEPVTVPDSPPPPSA